MKTKVGEEATQETYFENADRSILDTVPEVMFGTSRYGYKTDITFLILVSKIPKSMSYISCADLIFSGEVSKRKMKMVDVPQPFL